MDDRALLYKIVRMSQHCLGLSVVSGHLDDQPELRHRNLVDFRNFLESSIFAPVARIIRVTELPVKFVEFDDEGEI